MKSLYEQKGYSKDLIEKRLRGIAIRQELTDEWKNRKINKELEFAILTNEIKKFLSFSFKLLDAQSVLSRHTLT